MSQNKKEEHLDRIFHALADRTRRAILTKMGQGERTVSELAEPFDMSLAAVSKHLKVLEGAGLLKRTKDGRIHRCSMDAEPLTDAARIIEEYREFWKGQLDSLEEFLLGDPGGNKKR